MVTNSCGDLYIIASEKNQVVGTSKAIFTVKGKWWSGARATELRKDGGIHYLLCADSMVVPEDAIRKANAVLATIPEVPIKLGAHMAELAKLGYMFPKLLGHQVGRTPGTTEYTVLQNPDPDAGVALEQSLASKAGKPTLLNFSGWLSAAALVGSGRVDLLPRISYNTENTTMELGFPGVHLQNTAHLGAECLTCLALNPVRAVPKKKRLTMRLLERTLTRRLGQRRRRRLPPRRRARSVVPGKQQIHLAGRRSLAKTMLKHRRR